MKAAILQSLREVLCDWRWGHRCGYPICCITMYCWDRLWNLPPALTRCCSQGIDPAVSACGWVPCGIFHDGGSPMVLAERIRRILAFWHSALRPSSPTWRRSVQDPQSLRPPYVSRQCVGLPLDVELARANVLGPMEEAFAELDARIHSADLTWS